jgi:type I restriction enzyme M protein
MLNSAIKSKVDALWNKFWSGGIANPMTAIEQISYLLFMRRLEALDDNRASAAKFKKAPFESLYEGKYKAPNGKQVDRSKLRWSYVKTLPADQALDQMRDLAFPFIKTLGDNAFSKAMQDAVFIIPKASLLIEAMSTIEDIYTEIERERQGAGQTFHDIQGDLYEHLLGEIASAGKNGQFRTPRHIIQVMCVLLDPKLGDKICDPACGTGGFLLGAYQHVLTQHTSTKFIQKNEHGIEIGLVGDKLSNPKLWNTLTSHLHGFDFDTTMVRIAQMNLMLHGIVDPDVRYMDTLSKKFDEADKYDVVLANPPFKGSIDKGDLNEELTLDSTKTELLFVDRILNLLRNGGRAGVIVPTGVLFGGSKAHIALRKRLLEDAELQAVVNLPSGVFRPYAGVSTAALVFVKGGVTRNVWFYDLQADGYSMDDKRQKIEKDDIPDLLGRWSKRDPKMDIERTARAFFVSRKEIEENKLDLSVNRYKDVKLVVSRVESPAAILKRLSKLENEIVGSIAELEGELKK